METKFDTLTKGMARSVSRRQALRRLGIGLAAMGLACFGFANKAEASSRHCSDKDCLGPCPKGTKCGGVFGYCVWG